MTDELQENERLRDKCLVWASTGSRQITNGPIPTTYDKFSPYPAPYCSKETLTNSDNVNHVHLEVDAVKYSCPEAMEVQARTRTSRKTHVVYVVSVNTMVNMSGVVSCRGK